MLYLIYKIMQIQIDKKELKGLIAASGQLLGAHMFITNGFLSAVEKAEEFGFNAIQIFTKNATQWNAKEIDNSVSEKFKASIEKSNIKFAIAHSSYLINLASPNPNIRNKSIYSFRNEIIRCLNLGIKYLNFHPGSSNSADINESIKLIARALNEFANEFKYEDIYFVLETVAGQGSSIGYKFEHLRDIIALVNIEEKIKICVDTAHIFAAGYDISTKESFESTFENFNSIIGFDKLVCFHINDSKKNLGERIDRHEDIGKGKIGLNGFKFLMNDKRFVKIPKILETPKSKDQSKDLLNMKAILDLIE